MLLLVLMAQPFSQTKVTLNLLSTLSKIQFPRLLQITLFWTRTIRAIQLFMTVLILGVAKAESIWFLTREQHPAESLVAQGYEIMADLGLPVDSVKATPQTNCDILP